MTDKSSPPSATLSEGCQPGVLVELRDTLERIQKTGYGAMHGDLMRRCVSWIETLERQCLTYEHAAQHAERTIEALQRQQCSFEKRTVCSFAPSARGTSKTEEGIIKSILSVVHHDMRDAAEKDLRDLLRGDYAR